MALMLMIRPTATLKASASVAGMRWASDHARRLELFELFEVIWRKPTNCGHDPGTDCHCDVSRLQHNARYGTEALVKIGRKRRMPLVNCARAG